MAARLMIMDFAELVAGVSDGLEGIRACAVLSRDGFTLAVHPSSEHEKRTREVWHRLSAGGNPDRGFLVVDDETWVIARSDGYTGLVIADREVSPGLILDRLDWALNSIREGHEDQAPAWEPIREENGALDRGSRWALGTSDESEPASGSALDGDPEPVGRVTLEDSAANGIVESPTEGSVDTGGPDGSIDPADADPPEDAADEATPLEARDEAWDQGPDDLEASEGSDPAPEEEAMEDDVDPMSLASELSRLLGEGEGVEAG